MKILSWIATILSLTGIILNAYLIIWCWGIWMASNVLWVIWSIRKKEWSQTVLWVVFFVTNIYGWYQWNLLK
jgi:nicotinamide riboside transporter PnuC